MVFPAQKTAPDLPESTEGPVIFDIPSPEGSPTSPEAVSSIGLSQPNSNEQKTRQSPQPDSDDNVPKPGKIVDLSTKHKVRGVPIQTTDKVTTIADLEEEEFREEVDTVHEQRS